MKKIFICAVFILFVHQASASKSTLEQYKDNMYTYQLNLRVLMTPHMKRVAPDFPKQKPNDPKERADKLFDLIEITRNDKATPIAMPLLLCWALTQDEEVDQQSKKQVEALFQTILQEAKMEGKDIYSFELTD